MAEPVMTALIAACVSIIVALIGFAINRSQMKNADNQQERSIEQALMEKLYEQRLKHYPRGYEILARIRKIPAPHYLPHPDAMKSKLDELNIWAAEASLFFSKDSLKAYWELRNALNKNPAHGADYSAEQAQKVWHARNTLRKELRKDIGNLYNTDENEAQEDHWEYL